MDENGFTHSDLFAGNQNINYDNLNLFQSGSDPNFNHDASWGVNAGDFSQANQSRAQQSAPSWQQNANHLAAPSTHQGYNAAHFARQMSNSPASFAQNNFANYTGQQPQQQQPFQYRQQQQYDPSLVAQSNPHGQNFNVHLHLQSFNGSHQQNIGTIAPQTLDPARTFASNSYGSHGFAPNSFNQNSSTTTTPLRKVDQNALVSSIPRGADSGIFNIIDARRLSEATGSEPMGNFVNVGKEAQDWDVTRSALPAYVPRLSRNELRARAANNPAALAKIGQKSKSSSSDWKRRSLAGSVGSPSLKREQNSSSEDSSSSEDDSEYTDDDDDEFPLPEKRPESPKGAVEWDVAKAVFLSKKKAVGNDTIKKCLAEFWEVIKTIRDRWKADAAAVTDADAKKKTGELPLLKSRVKDQREMMEAAFKTVLKYGHRNVIEFLSENLSLIFICYQFLLDRFREEDFNGSLPRAMLELMSQFTTLTLEKLEKTHLDKVLNRFQKKGDAKTRFYVNKILTNAETATKEAASKSEQKKSDKAVPENLETKTASPSAKKSAPDSVAGVKRPAAASAESAVQKKVATGTSKVNGTTAASRINGSGAIKKPSSSGDASKAAAAGNATRKTVVAKPSGFFSGLQSATKKPGTSNAERAAKPATSKPLGTGNAGASTAKPAFDFAQTMANLTKPKEVKKELKPEKEAPPETEEERAKRLRKEQRRKLRVSFKPASELVQIRYFTHDPQEEIDHDSSQMRDLADVGGEGRMFKQQQHMMDLDDEDDAAEEEQKLVEFKSPSPIDFSTVPSDERSRNYAPYGGGELQLESSEKAQREEYENSTIMVVYAETSQIPPTPKEPENPYSGDQGGPIKFLGPMEDKYAARARARSAQYMSHPGYGQAQASGGQSYPYTAPPQQQSASQVQSILDTLRNFQQPTTQQQPASTYSIPFVGGQAPNNFQPPPPPPQPLAVPAGQIDLASILAQIQTGAQQQPATYNYGAAQQHQHAGAEASQKKGNNQNNRFYKTKVCRYWQEGKCQKGDACSYLHE